MAADRRAIAADHADRRPARRALVGGLRHETKPPARYTEASLTKQLEERGIGRPSTYPTITENLVNRDYVMKRGSALVPTWLGFSVIRLLEATFGDLVDFDFTARMEEILDLIATGREERVAVLKRFYFGDHAAGAEEFDGLLPMVERSGEIDARANASFQIPGLEAVVRVGRYGPYLLRGEDRANLPLDIAPDELTAEKAEELLGPTGDHELGPDPDTGRMIVPRAVATDRMSPRCSARRRQRSPGRRRSSRAPPACSRR